MKNKPFISRLSVALMGIYQAWRREASFKTQSVAGILAIGYFFWLQPSLIWWGLLVFSIAMVLAAELFNSAIEALLDHLHPAQHPEIGVAKDMAAAGVLILSISSLLIAALATLSVL